MSPSLPELKRAPPDQQSLSASRVSHVDRGRKATESAVLALIALVGVWCLRFSFESPFWFSAELLAVLVFSVSLGLSTRNRTRLFLRAGLLASPLIFAFVARAFQSPITFEMTALSTLGVGSLTLALNPSARGSVALSVVTSGFLVLFTTLIADDVSILSPALFWIILCLWHLVANHWERVTTCTPDEVRRSSHVRPAAVVVGLLLLALGGAAIHGRASMPQRLSWGIMPTSGGSSWSDPAARSGVGSGDAAIAAKDHAESFGAVESELFLESTDSTLFDMFSDSIGQPKLKQKWERRQGMTPEKLIEAHQHTAKSERGGGSFSTSRSKPPTPTALRDAEERAVLQWIGPMGIRLAMNRYDTFDGVDWSQQASWKNDELSRVAIDDEAWFFDPRQIRRVVRDHEEFAHSGVLKVLRLNSTRIPSPMMTAGVHIKEIDRPDFFGIERDGSVYMPGREKIPALTVLHLASTSVMEDELLLPAAFAVLRSPPMGEPTSRGQSTAGELAKELTANETRPYRKLQSIVEHLRSEFTFDRQSVAEGDDPLDSFLSNKRGGDHLFATAAAVMARAVGFQSRLVSGFYVRPRALDIGQGHASVIAEDAHVWVEIQLNDGRWIELEPTPGYRQPVYRPSAWLLAKQFVTLYWPHVLSAIAIGTLAYLTRVVWFELFARVMWLLGHLFPARVRVRVLLWILQRRARLAGKPRRIGLPQRDWLLSITRSDVTLEAAALACCDAADQMVFGGQDSDDWSAPANVLVRNITTRYISRGSIDETTQSGMVA